MLANGHLVDVGPNWIHGTNRNPILDLAKQTKTSVGTWDTRSHVFDEDGRLLPLDEAEKYSTLMWDIILEAFNHSNKHCPEISPDESLLDFFRKRVVELIPNTMHDFERQRKIVLQMAELWGAFIGTPITKQSLRYFWLEECIEGGMLLDIPRISFSQFLGRATSLFVRTWADQVQKTYFAQARTRRYSRKLPGLLSGMPRSSTRQQCPRSTQNRQQQQMRNLGSRPPTDRC
jgi:hypothetical protein